MAIQYFTGVTPSNHAQHSQFHHLLGPWSFNISQASHHQIMHSTVNSITCQVDGHSLLNRRHTIKSCTAQSTPSPARSMAIQYFTGVTPSNHAQHSQLHHLPGRWPFNISQASHHQIMHNTVNSITCQVDGHSIFHRRHTIKSCTAQSTPSPARSMAIQYFTGVTRINHAQHSQLHHLLGRWPLHT